jgi:membrane protein DedA with SNARE-associated domain
MESLQPHLDFLARHLYLFVFGAFLVEAAGVPFPSRIILLIAATLMERTDGLVRLVLASSAGALLGDHVPYLAGKLVGPRLLSLYCRLTLGSERCVEKTVASFVRYGAAAILLSRFSTSVRIFSSALSGCGHISYGRFLLFDIVGTLVYSTLWVTVGYLIGDRAAEILDRVGGARFLLAVGPVAFGSLLGYRLWRRRRYGPARAAALAAATCEGPLAPGSLGPVSRADAGRA